MTPNAQWYLNSNHKRECRGAPLNHTALGLTDAKTVVITRCASSTNNVICCAQYDEQFKSWDEVEKWGKRDRVMVKCVCGGGVVGCGGVWRWSSGPVADGQPARWFQKLVWNRQKGACFLSSNCSPLSSMIWHRVMQQQRGGKWGEGHWWSYALAMSAGMSLCTEWRAVTLNFTRAVGGAVGWWFFQTWEPVERKTGTWA